MVFSSLVFIFLFLPFTVISYYIIDNSWKNIFLLIISILFYAWGEPIYVFVMILSIIINYYIGIFIDNFSISKNIRKLVLIIGIAFNLLFIIFFKYSILFLKTISIFNKATFSITSLHLPLGISFYTFQCISYILDVYNKKYSSQKNIIKFALYIAMFPQLVAGPIISYSDIELYLTKRIINMQDFFKGIDRFIIGLGKKVLLANNFGLLWTNIKNISFKELSSLEAWLGIIAFALQIYFDFGGYSDMAIGLSKLFGFNFKENFKYPYISINISEFWRRWHISLSTWFKTYVYFPLGGRYVKPLKLIRNLLFVWILTGMWHGASWNFVIWGLYYGLIIIVEKFFLKEQLKKLPIILQHFYTIFFILIGWVIFEFEKISDCLLFICSMFGLKRNTGNFSIFSIQVILLLIGIFAATPIPKKGHISNLVER